MNLKSLFWDTRLHVAFTLFLIWLLALWQFKTINVLIYPILSITVVTALDLTITWVRDRKLYFPSASFVSGFLIGLIIDTSEPALTIIVASLLASLSKQFIKAGTRQHIFNPAAFGIMATYFIFQTPVAWWGVAWGQLPLFILVPLMIRILWRLKRLFLPIGFLLVYFLYLLTFMPPERAARTLLDGTTLLFTLVMLPEPITSPVIGKFKYLFGVLVAFLAIVISKTTQFPEVFLPALLLANLISFLILRFGKTSAKFIAPKAN